MYKKHHDTGTGLRACEQMGQGRQANSSLRLSQAVESLEPRLFLSTTYPLAPAKSPLVGPMATAVHNVTVHKPLTHPPRTHKPPHKQPDLFPPDTGDDHDAFPLPASYVPPTSTTTTAPQNNLSVVGGTWQSFGPAPIQNGQIPGSGNVSGRVVSIAPSPTDPNTIYIAAAGGGVWKTTNGGTSWAPLTDGQATTVMGALAMAPSNTNVIYAGTGEANNSGDSMYSQGILKSTDAGATWFLVGASQFFGHAISKIVVDPGNANIVYVAATSFAVNGIAGSTGIWKTADGGATWTNTTAAAPNFLTSSDAYSDLVMAPGNSNILYCAIGSYFGSSANGIYETTDAGGHWSKLANFSGGGTSNGRIALAIAPSNASVLYASSESVATSGLSGVFTSTDGGANWSTISPPFNYMGGQGWYDQTIIVNPTNSSVVYVAGSADSTRAVMVTSNAGTSWTGIATGAAANNGPHADHHAMAFDASGRLLDGNDGGVWRLDNSAVGSIAWTDLNTNLQITQFVGIAIARTNFQEGFGGAQDNGTSQLNPGSTFTLRESGDGGEVAVSPYSNSRIYHVAPVGSFGTANFFRRSDNGGTVWNSETSGITSASSANFYPPFVVDPLGQYPAGSDHLLLGTNQVYESTNSAASWTAISSPGSGGWTTSNAIDAIGVATLNMIYASAGGATFVTTNRGVSWTEHDIVGTGGTAHIAQIAVDPNNSLNAYAVSDRFNNGNVFRTVNGGVTWTNISGNLPNSPTYSIVCDPSDGAIYIGNDIGVFTSSNQGGTWYQLGTGLPTTEVHDLKLNDENVLAAGTYGRGMWQINPPFAISGTAGADTIYLKAESDNVTIDYWVNANIARAPTGTFEKTIFGSSVAIRGLGSADTITFDESAGDVLLGQNWVDDIGAGGSANVKIIGSSGNDTYSMDSTGTRLTYANNGGAGRILNLANAASLNFFGNGGADTITTAGPTPFIFTLASTGSATLTAQSGSGAVTANLPVNNDNLTINGGVVTIDIGPRF
jgi:hypothetical protein